MFAPNGVQQASLNFQNPELMALINALPQAPAAARQQCLQMCGLSTDTPKEEGDDSIMSYDYSDNDSSDDDYSNDSGMAKRNLRSTF